MPTSVSAVTKFLDPQNGYLGQEMHEKDDRRHSSLSKNIISQLKGAVSPDYSLYGIEEIDIRKETNLSNLQETWPIMPQLFRRRSCEMTVMGPCVKKAVTHLEMVQDLIEQWFQMDTMSHSPSSNRDVGEDELKTESVDSAIDLVEEADDQMLTDSIPESAPASPQTPAIHEDVSEEDSVITLTHVNAEEVIDEVLTLLARLEKDRQDMEVSYINESRIVSQLNDKLGAYSRKRLLDLPKKVQQEHENAIYNMKELEWHVHYNDRRRRHLRKILDHSKSSNKRLLSDIEVMNTHIPQMSEKLTDEEFVINAINMEQNKADNLLKEANEQYEVSLKKKTEALNKADKERKTIESEIEDLKNTISDLEYEIDECNRQMETSKIELSNLRTKMSELEGNLIQEKKEVALKEELEKDEEKAGTNLERRLTRIYFDQEQLAIRNSNEKLKLDKKKEDYKNELEKKEREVIDKEKLLTELNAHNRSQALAVEDCIYSIKICESDIFNDQNEMVEVEKEKVSEQERVAAALDSVGTLLSNNAKTKQKLKQAHDKQKKMETTLQQTLSALLKQIEQEKKLFKLTESKMSIDCANLSKSREETDKALKKAKLTLDDLEASLETMREKYNTLMGLKEKYNEQIDGLEMSIDEYRNKMYEINSQYQNASSIYGPMIQNLNEEETTIALKIAHLEYKQSKMIIQQREMEDNLPQMDKESESLKDVNTKLEVERDEVIVQVACMQQVYNNLMSMVNAIKDRLKEAAKKHREIITVRRSYLNSQISDRIKKLEENKSLASRYRTLQNDYFNTKNRLLCIYDERIKYEFAIKSLRQLWSLQKQMHAALVKYFKYREQFCKFELQKLDQMSRENGCTISGLRGDIDRALHSMSGFLRRELKDVKGSILSNIKSSSTLSTASLPSQDQLPTTPITGIATFTC